MMECGFKLKDGTDLFTLHMADEDITSLIRKICEEKEVEEKDVHPSERHKEQLSDDDGFSFNHHYYSEYLFSKQDIDHLRDKLRPLYEACRDVTPMGIEEFEPDNGEGYYPSAHIPKKKKLEISSILFEIPIYKTPLRLVLLLYRFIDGLYVSDLEEVRYWEFE